MGKWCFWGNLSNRRTKKSILLIKKLLVLVEMMSGLVNASFSLPEWQAVKMIFFAPCNWWAWEPVLLRLVGAWWWWGWWESWCFQSWDKVKENISSQLFTVVTGFPRDLTLRARSIQPKFPEISAQNSMNRLGPTGKVSKKLVHLLRWTTFPGWTGRKFGWVDGTLHASVFPHS